MSKDLKIKLNLRQLNKLMRSQPVQSKVNAEAGRMSARAGDKFRVTPSPHRYTARAFVEPKPGERLSDADRLALIRALRES